MKKLFQLSIIAAFIAIFTVACDNNSSPSNALQNTINCLIAEDFDGFADGLYVEGKSDADIKESRSQLAAFMKLGYAETKKDRNGIKEVKVIKETIEPGDTTANIEMETVYGNGETKSDNVKMKKVDGKWYLQLF